MIKKKQANEARLRRHRRVRKKVSGTGLRPRLSVFRSGNHIYAQIVDDERKTTLVAASSRDADMAALTKAESATRGTRPAAPSKAEAKAETKAEVRAEPASEISAEPKGKGGKGDAKAGAKAGAKPDGKTDGKGKAKTAASGEAPADGEPEAPVDKLAAIADNRRVLQARLVGRLVAQRAKAHGIERIVFDRGGYLYHGRVAALAAGAREGGLDF
jgi:ribosomal protein L18